MKKAARSSGAVGVFALCGLAASCATEPPERLIEIGCDERDDLTSYGVRFEAEGLDDFEGARAVLVTGLRLSFEDTICTSRAAVTVADGGFTLTLEGRTDGAAYPLVGVFIDQREDGRCDGELDPAWHEVWSVPPGEEITVAIAADDLAGEPDAEHCAPFE